MVRNCAIHITRIVYRNMHKLHRMEAGYSEGGKVMLKVALGIWGGQSLCSGMHERMCVCFKTQPSPQSSVTAFYICPHTLWSFQLLIVNLQVDKTIQIGMIWNMFILYMYLVLNLKVNVLFFLDWKIMLCGTICVYGGFNESDIVHDCVMFLPFMEQWPGFITWLLQHKTEGECLSIINISLLLSKIMICC